MNQILISENSLNVLEYLFVGKTLPDPLPDGWDECLQQLSENDMIVYKVVGHKSLPGYPFPYPIYEVSITETGRAYFESVRANSAFSNKQLEILQGISDRFEQRVAIAQKEAERAKKDSHTATVQSWIAIGVSVLTFLFQLMPLILGIILRLTK